MLNKLIIEDTLNKTIKKHERLRLKCSKTKLRKKDKIFIDNFNPDDYIENEDIYENQDDVQLKHNYPIDQHDALDDWGGGGYEYINGKIYKTETYKRAIRLDLIDTEKFDRETESIKQAIEDSPRLVMNAVMHRYGHWDEGTEEGHVVVQKGFASTSFSEEISEDFSDDFNGRYHITYYIPANSKGVLLNDQFDALPEKEWLTGPGMRQYILNVDDDERYVKLLILPE